MTNQKMLSVVCQLGDDFENALRNLDAKVNRAIHVIKESSMRKVEIKIVDWKDTVHKTIEGASPVQEISRNTISRVIVYEEN